MANLEKYHQKDEIKIDFYDTIHDVIKDLWLVILIGIASAMCAYLIANLLYKPAYETRATFVVSSKGYNSTYMNLNAANTVAESMTSIFSSNVLENKVAKDLGLKKIPGSISAQVINGTNLFELKVISSAPELSYKIIKSIMNNYTSVTNDVFGNAILDVLEAPNFPMHPDNPINAKKIMELAFVLGMAAMILILVALSITRDNVKNEEEITKKLNTKLFGVIYHEAKNKTLQAKLRGKNKSILITNPTVSFNYVECIKKIRSKFEYKASRNGGNVLLVTSVLENEGKSTLAANLALSLAQKSKKVLLIDADFCNPSVYKILQKDVKNGQEISDCITGKNDLKNALTFDDSTGLFLLIGRKYYHNSNELVSGDSFQKLISIAKKMIDYIIIDAPPLTSSADTEILADSVDLSLLVVRQSTAIAKDINDAIDILSGSKSELLGCIFNNVHKKLTGYRLDYGSKYSYQHYYGHYAKRNLPSNDITDNT